MTPVHLLVIAKAPVPGQVKTRLCPPCTPEQAAVVAGAALADTISAVDRTPVALRTLVLSGEYRPPPHWRTVPQRGTGFGERLANAFVDTARPALAAMLIGMDTPQVDPDLLVGVAAGLARADAVIGGAEDGGWWVLGLRDPFHAQVLRDVPTSRPDTGERTIAALRRAGLTVAIGPTLRDVDTADDARAVADACPHGRFAAAVRRHVPSGVGR